MAIFRSFCKDERGAVLAFVGILAPVLVGLAALTVDATMVEITGNRQQISADGAALAAARQLPDVAAARRAAERQIRLNNPDLGAGEVAALFSVVTGNWDGTTFTRSGSPLNAVRVDVRRSEDGGNAFDTLFARVFGDESVDIGRAAVATKSIGTELALVLDTTGSMNDYGKIGDLRSAAQTLLTVLFDGQETQPDLYVSVVPYVASVNSGNAYTDWLVDLSEDTSLLPNSMADYQPTTWKGCTRERLDHDATLKEETSPAAAPFDPYFWPSATWGCWRSSTNCWPDWRGRVDESGVTGGSGPNFGCGDSVLALTQSYSELTSKVAGLRAADYRFGTQTDVGLAWGWRTLSPHWRGQWRDSSGSVMSTLPLDYDTPLMSKIIILMTDGDNQYAYSDYTAYGFPNEIFNENELDAEMLDVCRSIKAQGIILYTISFGAGISSTAQLNLEDCASARDQDPRYPGQKYFHAPTGETLTETFQTIGRQVNDVRLVQ